MDQLDVMAVFVAVVERGGIVRAAHALKRAKGTVSAQITKLEKHLGATLINRTTRTMALTDQGTAYYELSKRVLEDIAAYQGERKRMDSQPHGILRVEANDSIASKLLMPVIFDFQRRYPQLQLEIVQTAHMFDTTQQGLDVMIRQLLEPAADSRLVIRPLGYSRTVFVATPEYLARHGTPASPDDLSAHRCIGYLDPGSGRLWEWMFERGGERSSLDISCELAFSDGNLGLDAALRGFGIFTTLSNFAQPHIARGELIRILDEWTWQVPPLCVMYTRRPYVPAKLRVFIDYLQEKYPAGEELQPYPRG